MNFSKHYTAEEARALLPQVREWLDQLVELREELGQKEATLEADRPPGGDLGGPVVDDWVRCVARFHSLLLEFRHREIQIKDLDRGLVDFPAIRSGREVFLCWEKSEADIRYWHDLDSGYAGREPL